MSGSDPVTIISGTNVTGPTTPVRIANWDAFIAAVVAAIGNGDSGNEFDSIQFNTSYTPSAHSEGLVYFDNEDRTLVVDLPGAVSLQIGQEQHLYARNNTGVTIANGQIVYISGAIGNRPTVALARADAVGTSMVAAIATDAVANNSDGYFTTFGIVRGLNTNAYAAGTRLYLSATTAGEFTNVVPASPNNITHPIGVVIRRNPAVGSILFFPKDMSVFGDVVGGNYSQIEADGTLRFVGNATTWRDELGPLLGQRLQSPGSDITQNLPEGTITFKASARYPADYITYTLQLNHDWLVQSTCDFHVHWWQASAANVNWLVEYRWQVNGQAKTAGWTQLPLTSQIFTYAAGTLNQINDGSANITPPATAQLSDIFQVRLYRDYTNVSTLFAGAEASGLDVEAMSSDMHRRSDTIGSREEYAK